MPLDGVATARSTSAGRLRTSPSARSKPTTPRLLGKRAATAAPIPLADPVTNATRPSGAWRSIVSAVTGVSAPTWTIEGPRHAGITVSDLDRSLEFYCGVLGLELRSRRLYEERQIAEIVAVPEATALDIAFLRLPGSDVEIELLDTRAASAAPAASRPSDTAPGTSRVRERHRCAVRRARRARRRVPLRRAGRA